MSDLYKTLMNRGFLIYEHDAKFVLHKIPTPTDTRSAIVDSVQPNASSIKFDTYDQAVQEAKSLINWQEEKVIAVQQSNSCWFMELMYQHKSGPKVVDLGEMGAVSYSVAILEAENRATRYIEESCAEEDIEGWEVRVRPRPK